MNLPSPAPGQPEHDDPSDKGLSHADHMLFLERDPRVTIHSSYLDAEGK